MKKTRSQLIFMLLTAWMFLMSSAYAQISNATNPDWAELFEKNKERIVSITVTGTSSNDQYNNIPDELKPFFSIPRGPRRMSGSGSGFIIDSKGLIITNAHVVKDADEITVHLADRSEHKAELLGSDEKSDVALLKIDKDNLPAVEIADISTLKVGQPVLAVGSPFGLDYTATQGIISSLARNLPNDFYTPFIQTDAAVNPGNSGGPLFNAKGEVIGINSQIYSRTGNYAGISFSIPIDIAMHVVEQLEADGKVTRGWLGVTIQEITPDLAKSFGMDAPDGALVGEIMQDSPAQKAGLEPGDIILKFNNTDIPSSQALPAVVAVTKPDTEATIEILRNGETITLPVTIEALPDDNQIRVLGSSDRANGLGMHLRPTPNNVGVEIAQIEQDAKLDLEVGDIILRVNNTKITSLSDFANALKPFKSGQIVRMLVKRQQITTFIPVKIP